VDPAMLDLDNLNYDPWRVVYFQRASVIVLELALVFALNWYALSWFV
jgi:alpha-1,3-glucosyltransferase